MAGVLNFLRSDSAMEEIEREKLFGAEAPRRLADIPVDLIAPNASQPRRHFDEEELGDLAASISEVGIIQPVVVIATDSGYELIAGERRLRAAKQAGLSTIPAVVTEANPEEQQILALVENIQRSNLSAVEEAAGLQAIMDRTGMTQTELAEKLGRSQSSVANKLRLLRLEEPVQRLVMEGKLGERQARALLALPPEDQTALAEEAASENMAAGEVEQRVKERGAPGRTAKRVKKSPLSFAGPDGPTGDILKDVAGLVEANRKRGIPVVWKVKELAQRELVIELVVDLKGAMGPGERGNGGEPPAE
ncbi:MAG: ParB/RepB/Spo0J family partition protein [Aminivibrio sp.]|jgi:ParB family chromosome partitioning protein|nr:ParB/RepB/Spo0J family partition protein [Synergistaceae bacterium]